MICRFVGRIDGITVFADAALFEGVVGVEEEVDGNDLRSANF